MAGRSRTRRSRAVGGGHLHHSKAHQELMDKSERATHCGAVSLSGRRSPYADRCGARAARHLDPL